MDEPLLTWLDLIYRVELFGGIGVLIFLETLRPNLPATDDRARAYHVLNNFALWMLSFLLADILLHSLVFPADPFRTGMVWGALLSELPLWGQILTGVVLLDLASWVLHWLCHRYRWLWLLHAVHHSDPSMDVSTTLRTHPGEAVVSVVWQALVLFLLGLPLWILACRIVVSTPVALFHHSNVALPERFDRILRTVFVSPAVHRVHHSPVSTETNSNYAFIFSFWDRIFATYHAPETGDEVRFGLDALRGREWQSLTGMLRTPLKARSMARL